MLKNCVRVAVRGRPAEIIHAEPDNRPGEIRASLVVRILSRCALFADLNDDVLQEIAEQGRVLTFGTGQTIVWAGEPTQAMYLVVRGETQSYRMSLEGRKYVLNRYGPGEFFNLAPVLDGGINTTSVETVTDAMVFALLCDQCGEIVRSDSRVALAALKHLASAVGDLSDAAVGLALHPVRARLARFLLSEMRNHAHRPRPWTQGDIAMHIGSVREVVGRTLRSFSNEGLISWDRDRPIVVDQVALAHEARVIEPMPVE